MQEFERIIGGIIGRILGRRTGRIAGILGRRILRIIGRRISRIIGRSIGRIRKNNWQNNSEEFGDGIVRRIGRTIRLIRHSPKQN